MRTELFWRPVVVSARKNARTALIEALRSRTTVPEESALAEFQRLDVVVEWVQSRSANICFIDVAGNEELALQAARTLADQSITVVAFHTNGDAELILRCLRAGVHEFLSEPFDPQSVWPVLDALSTRRLKGGPNLPGSVYLVLPSKQSFGATTVATGLAVRASRETSGSVLLVDLDPLFGSIRFQLKVKGGSDFLHAFSNWSRIDGDLWRQLTVNYSGMDVLLAPEIWVDSAFEAPAPTDFVHLLRQRYSLTFLDCPGLITNWYKDLASEVDGVFVVSTNEFMAIHATKKTLETLDASGCDTAKVKLIVNRYSPEFGVAADAIEAALGKPIFHTLPNDYESLQKAIFNGKPAGGDCKIGKGLDDLWLQLLGRPRPAKAQGSWPSLLARLKR